MDVPDLVEPPAVVTVVVLEDLATGDLLRSPSYTGPTIARLSVSFSGMRARNSVLTAFIRA